MKKIMIAMVILLTSLNVNAQNENTNATNGLFVDALIGISSLSSHYYKGTDGVAKFSFNARVGSKWYKGNSGSNYTPGFQMTWTRLGVSTFVRNISGSVIDLTSFDIMPLNIGYTGYLKFNDNVGLETNFNVGPGFSINKYNTLIGLHINPELKLRYKALALGLDFSFFNGENYNQLYYTRGYWYTLNTYSLVLGIKL